MKDNKFKLGAKLDKLLKEKAELPSELGNMSKNFFVENFKRQGFLDSTVERWAPRKHADAGRAILVQSGDLRKSIRILRKSKDTVVIGSDLKYAGYHNSGTGKLPKREFVGDSVELRRKLKAKIILELNKAMK